MWSVENHDGIRKMNETKTEVNLAHINDDEHALLITECRDEGKDIVLLNEGGVSPKQSSNEDKVTRDSNMWYLDNGASNHMTG